MKKVVFVGDEASATNVSPDIAFVGARCFDTVVNWIKTINPDYYVCLNSDTISQLSDVKRLQKAGFSIIALGNKASERLHKLNIPHFKLPHPSGLNRKLNDKENLKLDFQRAINYING